MNLFSDDVLPSYIYTYPTKKAYKPFTDWKKAATSWEKVTGNTALYIHIPFCQMKCSFCDLFTVTNQENDVIERYVQAICKEIELMKPYLNQQAIFIRSIYFGGGTPTLLNKSQLITILARIRQTFVIDDDAEISIEGAPNSFTDTSFAMLRALGFNRVSIGIQSFDATELAAMGRFYEATLGQSAALQATTSGIKNVNLDLIYGIPGQTWEQWEQNLTTALNLKPQTITCYPLVVRDATAYGAKIARGICSEPVQAKERYQWYDKNLKILSEHGYKQHTFVTFGKSDGGCRHELNEFEGMPTLSFGAGARKYAPDLHYVDEDYALRKSNKVTMFDYMNAVEQDTLPVLTAAEVGVHDQRIRKCILGLLSSGIDKNYTQYFPELFEALFEQGYAHTQNEVISLMPKGMRYSSHIGHYILEHASSWYQQEPFGAFWEKGYRNLDISCMGAPSFEVAEILPALATNAKVLDLGCGEGRNALFLAQNGCDVTAVDRPVAAITKLKHLAKKHNVTLNAVVCDIANFPITEQYDLIMAHGVLYYLENSVWRTLLQKVKQHTKVGGYNIFTLFVYDEEHPCSPEIQAASYKSSFKPKELQEFYQDWNELRYDQYVKWDSHPDIGEHCHPIEKLVAQKSHATYLGKLIDIGQDLPSELFMKCKIGLHKSELTQRIGSPQTIDKVEMKGTQFATSGHKATCEGYCLELWYYGKYVFYVGNDLVTGKAHFRTSPVCLARNVQLLMGSPGSGKSTLAKKLEAEGYFVISMGNSLREAAKIDPTIKKTIDEGRLISDAEAIAIFNGALKLALKVNKAIVIEGFGSTMAQYEHLLHLTKRYNLNVELKYLQCPDEVAIERIVNRLMCPVCHASYTNKNTHCNGCNIPLYKRPEDTKEIAQQRIQRYKESVADLRIAN